MRLDHMLDHVARKAGRATPEELRRRLRSAAGSRRHPPGRTGRHVLSDALEHGLDVRRPLGIGRTIPTDRLRIALDTMSGLDTMPVAHPESQGSGLRPATSTGLLATASSFAAQLTPCCSQSPDGPPAARNSTDRGSQLYEIAWGWVLTSRPVLSSEARAKLARGNRIAGALAIPQLARLATHRGTGELDIADVCVGQPSGSGASRNVSTTSRTSAVRARPKKCVVPGNTAS
jgi:hypothetical protein